MRTSVRGCVGFALVVGLVAGTIAGAQASVADKSVKKFCEKALEISNTVPDVSGGKSAVIDAARGYQKQYKKLAKLAPTKPLRNAAKAISRYYARVAGSGDLNSDAANYTDEEQDAINTIIEHNTAKCAAAGVVPTT